MQPEPQPPALRISDTDREQAAEFLQRACGDGRLTLEEFSVRVGAVWAADTSAELALATEGLVAPPPVGTQTVERVVNVFGESRRAGRWRLPRALRVTNAFGSCVLDLREAVVGAEAIAHNSVSIYGTCAFGEVRVIVPEGVEVDLGGANVFGSRSIRLAPVARVAGTPVVEVRINVWFGEVSVRSAGPSAGSALRRITKDLFS